MSSLIAANRRNRGARYAGRPIMPPDKNSRGPTTYFSDHVHRLDLVIYKVLWWSPVCRDLEYPHPMQVEESLSQFLTDERSPKLFSRLGQSTSILVMVRVVSNHSNDILILGKRNTQSTT